MGNIPLQGGGSAVDEIDRNLKKNQNIGHVQAVFPSDNIITTLYTAVPAAIIGFLLLFSNTAVGEYAIICAPLRKFINDRTDFRFIASYCWGLMTDSTIDENGDFTGTEQSVNYMTQFQYYMFFLSFGGIMLKYYFIGFSGRIGKEVEYVIHGIEELSSHLIMKLKKLNREDFEGGKTSAKHHQTTDFDEIVEASENRKAKLPGLKLVEWSNDEISHFEMFQKYLNHRGKRIWFVLQIFSTRLLCIGLTTLASTIMYSYFIEDAISDDGRNLGISFQCKLPSQYWEVEEGNFTKKTVDCYLKGRKTLQLFTWAMIGFYAAINIFTLLSIFLDFYMLKKATRLLAHFPLRIKPRFLSDLDVIMSFVKIQPKPATLSLYRMLSGLNRNEENEYQRFYWEFIQWLDSDEEVGELLEKAGYDHFKQSTKKHS